MKKILFSLAGLLAAGLAALPAQAQTVKHTLPALPYSLDALAPKMSRETLEYHYGKHYPAYIDKVNALVIGTPYAQKTLEEIVLKAEPGPLFNNAAQALNHKYFFFELSPTPQSVPTGPLAEAINEEWGSFDNFKTKFSADANALFGSGWVWLATDDAGSLQILAESNAGNPVRHGLIPLLGLDVWEHSYYLDYQNKRAEYVANFWDLVDWRVIEHRYSDR